MTYKFNSVSIKILSGSPMELGDGGPSTKGSRKTKGQARSDSSATLGIRGPRRWRAAKGPISPAGAPRRDRTPASAVARRGRGSTGPLQPRKPGPQTGAAGAGQRDQQRPDRGRGRAGTGRRAHPSHRWPPLGRGVADGQELDKHGKPLRCLRKTQWSSRHQHAERFLTRKSPRSTRLPPGHKSQRRGNGTGSPRANLRDQHFETLYFMPWTGLFERSHFDSPLLPEMLSFLLRGELPLRVTGKVWG